MSNRKVKNFRCSDEVYADIVKIAYREDRGVGIQIERMLKEAVALDKSQNPEFWGKEQNNGKRKAKARA